MRKEERSIQRSCGHFSTRKMTWDEYQDQAELDKLRSTPCPWCSGEKDNQITLPPFEFGDDGIRQQHLDDERDREAARRAALPGESYE